jgi:hypothetical protein
MPARCESVQVSVGESRHDASFASAGEDYLYNFYYHKALAITSNAGIVRDICIESNDVISFAMTARKSSDVVETGSQRFEHFRALRSAFTACA